LKLQVADDAPFALQIEILYMRVLGDFGGAWLAAARTDSFTDTSPPPAMYTFPRRSARAACTLDPMPRTSRRRQRRGRRFR